MSAMLFAIAGFELRQQLRSPVFWIVFAVSAVMVSGSVSIDELRVGLGDEGLRNGAAAIVRTHLVWTLFYMFTSAALVADAVLRDDLTGFAPIIRSAPIRRADYLLGRFVGAFAAVLACFLSVPLAMAVGTAAPWIDPATVGPARPSAYVFALAVMSVPNLLLSAAAAFGLATMTRSMTGAFLGAVALLILYGLGSRETGALLGPLFEPFGFVAHAQVLDAWPTGARDAGVPWPAGPLLANRLIWLAVSGLLVALAFTRFAARPGSAPARPASPAASAAGVPPLRGVASPRFGREAALAQAVARTRLEIGQIVRTPAFCVLLLLATANAAARLWSLSEPPSVPGTQVTIAELYEAFQLVSTVVALFFAGELVWNERECGVHELIGAAPLPEAGFVLPKLLAIACVLAALAAGGALASVLVQLARGRDDVDLGAYLRWWIAPASFDWLLVAALAVFLQAVSPNKLAGWGWMVLYLVLSLTMGRLGLNDPIYRYGQYPGWPLPAPLSGAADVGWYRAYWGSAALVLTALACGLAGRGTEPLAVRLRRLPVRLHGSTGLVGVAAALGFVVLGLFLAAR